MGLLFSKWSGFCPCPDTTLPSRAPSRIVSPRAVPPVLASGATTITASSKDSSTSKDSRGRRTSSSQPLHTHNEGTSSNGSAGSRHQQQQQQQQQQRNHSARQSRSTGQEGYDEAAREASQQPRQLLSQQHDPLRPQPVWAQRTQPPDPASMRQHDDGSGSHGGSGHNDANYAAAADYDDDDDDDDVFFDAESTHVSDRQPSQ